MSKLTFEELYNRMHQSDFLSWAKKNIECKKYIGIDDKFYAIRLFSILFSVGYIDTTPEEDIDIVDLYKFYNIHKTIDIISQYIDIDIPFEKQDSNLYDLIHISGLYSYVLSCCKEDYNMFADEYDRVSGFNNLSIMSELNSMFEKLPKVTEFNDMMNDFNDIMKDEEVAETLRLLNRFEEFDNVRAVDFVNKSK